VVTEAGFTVEFVSPKGGKVEMDPKSHNLEDPINSAFLADPRNVQALENTKAPGDIRPSDYSAIYFAGGHGAMWDFAGNQVLADVASTIWQAGGVVAAVCHGPAGLVDITLPDGSYLVAGKRVAAFTNEEEAAVELTEVMPFLLATKLEERGAIHVPGPNFQEQVVVDDRLVTGQNPASAQAAGTAIVELLRASNPAKE
jgi:putative intracellular protease/amidase